MKYADAIVPVVAHAEGGETTLSTGIYFEIEGARRVLASLHAGERYDFDWDYHVVPPSDDLSAQKAIYKDDWLPAQVLSRQEPLECVALQPPRLPSRSPLGIGDIADPGSKVKTIGWDGANPGAPAELRRGEILPDFPASGPYIWTDLENDSGYSGAPVWTDGGLIGTFQQYRNLCRGQETLRSYSGIRPIRHQLPALT